jgi:hypothetical protein
VADRGWSIALCVMLAGACTDEMPASASDGGKSGSGVAATAGRGMQKDAAASAAMNGTGGTPRSVGGGSASGTDGGTSGPDGTGGTSGTKGSGGSVALGSGGARGDSGSGGVSGTGGMSGSGGTGGATGSGGASGSGTITYSTNFDLTESPISENGAWHHDGLDWTAVQTANGIARGTQALGVPRSGPGQYNDSYAYLTGFPPDQQASASVHLGSIDASCTHEVEILLHWGDSAHDARGYECNLAYDGSYAQIVRWNGAVGDFTYLANGSVPGGVHDGDVISASITGGKISLTVNGVERASAQDATFATGNPGIGLWRGSSGCGTLGDYGFTSYTASSR